METQPNYKKSRKLWGILFLASTLVFFATALGTWSVWPELREQIMELLSMDYPETAPTSDRGVMLLLISGVSLLTSVGTFLGFISTTVLSWRKEQREAKSIQLDNERKELEIEKLRLDLDKLRKEKEAGPSTRKDRKVKHTDKDTSE